MVFHVVEAYVAEIGRGIDIDERFKAIWVSQAGSAGNEAMCFNINRLSGVLVEEPVRKI